MDIGSRPEDPRAKSNRYCKNSRAKFDKDQFDYEFTQFLIDDNYVGDPPHVQVSIQNLNDNIDENFLRKDLDKFGAIRTVEIVRHPRTDRHLGLAKVQFEDASMATACVESYNDKQLMGRKLSVYKDIRFAKIELVKEELLNPKPQPVVPALQPPHVASALALASSGSIVGVPQPISSMAIQKPTLPLSLPASITNPSSLHHPPLLIPHQSQPPLLPHLDFQISTPGSMSSSSIAAASEASGRQRLEDRIAILRKQPNCVLSTIIGPTSSPTQNAPNAFITREEQQQHQQHYEYPNSSYYNTPQSTGLKQHDKQRTDLINDHQLHNSHHLPSSHHHQQSHHLHHRRSESSANLQHNHNHYHHNHLRDSYHNKYDNKINNSRSSRYQDNNYDDDWHKLPVKKEDKQEDEPFNIELTEKQIENEILPYCYEEFHRELSENLLTTIFKKLRENHGYQCLEKAQQEHKAKQDKVKIQKEKERIEYEQQKQYELRYMANRRSERSAEVSRPRVNLLRERTNDLGLMQDDRRRGEADLRRVNRSSAYVSDPERRGSHNTSVDSGSDSDTGSSDSSSVSSFSSSSFSSRSSRSSSVSSNRSASCSFSDSSQASPTHSKSTHDETRTEKVTDNSKSLLDFNKPTIADRVPDYTQSNSIAQDDLIAADALLCMSKEAPDARAAHSFNERFNNDAFVDEDDEMVKPPPKQGKRKKKISDMTTVATEYRSAKKLATGRTDYDENIENTMVEATDENLVDDKSEPRYVFSERSAEEKAQMLQDLVGTVSDEDIRYLSKAHDELGCGLAIIFGPESIAKSLLYSRKHMIEGKAAEGHPKWWRGCSRCDVIEVSEKGKAQIEENFEDLAKARFKSHVIQAATSSRRDQRGDQRRFAVLNSNLDVDYLKMFTTSTLQMRAKNLRFSRSKIHKWGLFACEKIASGDAVIEYVGEKIRPSVADHRENIVYANLPTHDGSSYFFRVDTDVIDATLKGNKARFINHSCNPNCFAKVIKHDNGSNSIVIYAKQAIQEDEEITYDYKFPREETEQKISCNCRAPNCQKFLN